MSFPHNEQWHVGLTDKIVRDAAKGGICARSAAAIRTQDDEIRMLIGDHRRETGPDVPRRDENMDIALNSRTDLLEILLRDPPITVHEPFTKRKCIAFDWHGLGRLACSYCPAVPGVDLRS